MAGNALSALFGAGGGLLRFPPVRLCMGNSGTTLAATPERAWMGYGVIGNTLDSDSSIPGSSPGTPAKSQERLYALNANAKTAVRYLAGRNGRFRGLGGPCL